MCSPCVFYTRFALCVDPGVNVWRVDRAARVYVAVVGVRPETGLGYDEKKKKIRKNNWAYCTKTSSRRRGVGIAYLRVVRGGEDFQLFVIGRQKKKKWNDWHLWLGWGFENKKNVKWMLHKKQTSILINDDFYYELLLFVIFFFFNYYWSELNPCLRCASLMAICPGSTMTPLRRCKWSFCTYGGYIIWKNKKDTIWLAQCPLGHYPIWILDKCT